MGVGTQLHETLRAGVHRHRGAHEALRLHLMLHHFPLQLRLRRRRDALTRPSTRLYSRSIPSLMTKHPRLNINICTKELDGSILLV